MSCWCTFESGVGLEDGLQMAREMVGASDVLAGPSSVSDICYKGVFAEQSREMIESVDEKEFWEAAF